MISETTTDLVAALNSALEAKGFKAEAAKFDTGNCAEFIRFIRPSRNNAEFGKIIKTENGWNTNWIGGTNISRVVLTLIERDLAASQASESLDATADRLDMI